MSEESVNIKKRIRELVDMIKKYDEAYFNNSISLISDYEYDCLVEELEQLEKKYPEFKVNKTPTEFIGENVTNGFKKVSHTPPMLSLKKTYSFDEINKFFTDVEKVINEKITYICELKLDGISINVHYENGILKSISTRGDGSTGDDITCNSFLFKNIPQKITTEIEGFDIRGEALMTFNDFETLNEELKNIGKDVLANPRNATSGTLKTLKFDKNDPPRNLTAYFYNLIPAKQFNLVTQKDILEKLKGMGFPICEFYKFCENKNDVFDFINYWEKKKKDLKFPIDGIVIKVNELKYYEQLGVTNKNPRYAIAYKYKPEATSTKLISVEFQIGRSGLITPVANFEPIELSGTIVQRATLHNENEMKKLDLKYGDKVLVKKSGEIIPKIIGIDIIGRDIEAKNIEFIKECPSCGSRLQKINDLHYCLNNSCQAKLIELLTHFVSKNALNIKTIGPKTIKLLVSQGLIKTQSDIFKLKYRDIARLQGFNNLSTKKMFDELEKSKNTPFDKILFGLGIPHVGEVVAKNITKYFKNIEAIKNASIEELQNVDLVGEEVAKSIFLFFKNENNLQIIENLKTFGFTLEEKNVPKNSQKLANLKFVVTGTFENVSRENIKLLIEDNGGIVQTSITLNTDFLILGDNPGEAKVAFAKKNNIKIVSYENFLNNFEIN